MEKLLNRFVGDERIRKAYGKAAVVTLILMWIYMVVRMLLVAMGIWEMNFIMNDFYFILISFIIFSFIGSKDETDGLLHSPFMRKELPYKEGRFGGRFAIYITEAILAAVIVTVLEFLVENLIVLSFDFDLLMIISRFIYFTTVFTLVITITSEIGIRKFRKEQQEV